MLIMFYPIVYNIQNDKDTRMLEIIFGVPDYRYKVYLLRGARDREPVHRRPGAELLGVDERD